jgi:carbonic anhydrase
MPWFRRVRRSVLRSETPEETIARLHLASGTHKETSHQTATRLGRDGGLHASPPPAQRPPTSPAPHGPPAPPARLSSGGLPELTGPAAAAWQVLEMGNRRWAAGVSTAPNRSVTRRRQVARTQAPLAVVVGCVDSRVPVELIFDVGVGDMFVVRTVAQALDDLDFAGVELAPRMFDTPLVVVLGHQRCAAVSLAVDAIEHRGRQLTGHDHAIVRALHPAYEQARHNDAGSAAATDPGLTAAVTRQQTLLTARRLRAEPELSARIAGHRLAVVAAYYDLDAGLVSRIG